ETSDPCRIREPVDVPPDWFLTYSSANLNEATLKQQNKEIVDFGHKSYRILLDDTCEFTPEFELVLNVKEPFNINGVAYKYESASGKSSQLSMTGDFNKEIVILIPRSTKNDQVYVSIYVPWTKAGDFTKAAAMDSISWTRRRRKVTS
ncbi:MAG TPA: hypothetical protein VFP64_12450, partial [Pyrinomonadaceae bacterium]|nr:hypothetical protein [Pyrinomonadaceae bacterium]